MVSTLVCSALLASSQLVCIDPGHPSENGAGTKGKSVTEVELVWDLSLKTKEFLRRSGVKVVLTKSKESEKVTNKERATIANESGAQLLLRVHADAGKHSGFGTFYPDKSAKVGGVYGSSQKVLSGSAVAAKAFHREVIDQLKDFLKDAGLKTDRATAIGSKQGALTGSVFSKIPVILVETCVLSNPVDEAKVATREGRLKIAEAMAKGIIKALKALE